MTDEVEGVITNPSWENKYDNLIMELINGFLFQGSGVFASYWRRNRSQTLVSSVTYNHWRGKVTLASSVSRGCAACQLTYNAFDDAT